MFVSLVAWGVFAALQGVIDAYWLLLIDRLALGVVEAAALPAMLEFLADWFTARERGRANTILILGNPVTLLWMSIVSGYLVSLTNDRWMFIIEGLPAIAWAFAFYRLSSDRPADVGWLSDSERAAVVRRLEGEQAQVPKIPRRPGTSSSPTSGSSSSAAS